MVILSNLTNKRRYLTPDEVARLIDAAKQNKLYGFRNATIILMMYRHGLRCSETISLQWHQFDLKAGTVAVNRLKNGVPSNHPLTGMELRALKRLRREHPHSRFVFLSQRGAPMTRQNVNVLLSALGRAAKIEVPVTPHMIRHSTGHKLVNESREVRAIQHFLGHKNIQSTVLYTHLNANRFNDWWND